MAEFNTHRAFSRNSASSRAIPVDKQLTRLEAGVAFPVAWPAAARGMQGGEELPDGLRRSVRDAWAATAEQTIKTAARMNQWGLHKSVVNRLLEPFIWHTVVVTATAWTNFFAQRSSPLAQPEIRIVSELMEQAYGASSPDPVRDGEWHLPYVQPDERDHSVADLVRISAARCARLPDPGWPA